MADNDKQDHTSRRGFASMDENRRREIARKGGKASHKSDKGNGGTPNNSVVSDDKDERDMMSDDDES